MTRTELVSWTLADAARGIKARRVSPVELAQACLARIDEVDRKVNSFITVCHDEALAAARKADRQIAAGNYRGPMHGIPYAVKDIFATKGVRTTSGSSVFKDNIPDYDSTAVARLNRAGAILVGKNHCIEFACGNHNPIYGEVQNPWKQGYSPGGSSSGSGAAVAAGMVFGSVGSCTTGSIRGPASHCGIVGLKPSYGLVSRYGALSLSWSLDHAGPMTRTVEDCALMLRALAGYDVKDPSSARAAVPDYAASLGGGIKGLRVGVPHELVEGASKEVSVCVEEAIKVLGRLGALVEEVSLPETGAYANTAANIIYLSEAAQIHAPWLAHLDQYTIRAQQKVLAGLVVSSTQYHKAQQVRRLIHEEMSRVLEKVDVLVGPVVRTPPGPIQPMTAAAWQPEVLAAMGRPSAYSPMEPFNLTGQPSISVPCGFSSQGLPVGLQIAGRLFDDATVLKAAHAYEQATQWHRMPPPL